MAYSTIPKGSLYMNTKIYTGNGSTNALTGIGFAPDWVWFKSRSNADEHNVFDKVRGVTKNIEPSTNLAEYTQSNGLTAFGSDGFTVGDFNAGNRSGGSIVAWNWKAGTTSIPSGSSTAPTAVSINATAGFGIYTYTGTGSTGRTLAHGLNSVVKMIIVKRLNSTRDWAVYHSSLANTEYLELNNDQAKATANLWGDTTPTSSLIYLGGDGQVNGGSDPYVMYAFASRTGYSKFGSYKGNSSTDGPFIYTGFKPAFVILKRADGGDSWVMLDNKRNEFNPEDKILLADTSGAEITQTQCDFLSNGFKLKEAGGRTNGNGNSHIYMAFAENPFVATSGSTAIPVTAR